MDNKLSAKMISITAGLAALSALTQLTHIGYQSPTWGMWIDIVAVSWVVAYFLYGFRISVIVSFVGALVITLFAPDTWLGASMKLIATLPLIFVFEIFVRATKSSFGSFTTVRSLVTPLVVGTILRCLFVLPLNYFYAIPIWTKMTPEAAWAAIPWFVIVIFNVVQSLLDVALAWILVYRFQLIRYAKMR